MVCTNPSLTHHGPITDHGLQTTQRQASLTKLLVRDRGELEAQQKEHEELDRADDARAKPLAIHLAKLSARIENAEREKVLHSQVEQFLKEGETHAERRALVSRLYV